MSIQLIQIDLSRTYLSNVFQSFLDFVQGGCVYRSAEINGQMEMTDSLTNETNAFILVLCDENENCRYLQNTIEMSLYSGANNKIRRLHRVTKSSNVSTNRINGSAPFISYTYAALIMETTAYLSCVSIFLNPIRKWRRSASFGKWSFLFLDQCSGSSEWNV